MIRKITFLCLCGTFVLLGGCTTSHRKTDMPQAITLTKTQMAEAKRLSGDWIVEAESELLFRIEVSTSTIKVEKHDSQDTPQTTDYAIYNFEEKRDRANIYGAADQETFYIREIDLQTIYIGGGKNIPAETAWQVKAVKQAAKN